MAKSQISVGIVGMGRIGISVAASLHRLALSNSEYGLAKIICFGRHAPRLRALIGDLEQVALVEALHGYLGSGMPLDPPSSLHILSPSTEIADLANCDILINCLGTRIPEKCFSPEAMLLAHDSYVKALARELAPVIRPDAWVLNLMNPIEAMTWRLRDLLNLPSERVIGVSEPAAFGPAASAVLTCMSVLSEKQKILSCSTWHSGFESYLTLPTCISRDGAYPVKDMALSHDQHIALAESASRIRSQIRRIPVEEVIS